MFVSAEGPSRESVKNRYQSSSGASAELFLSILEIDCSYHKLSYGNDVF